MQITRKRCVKHKKGKKEVRKWLNYWITKKRTERHEMRKSKWVVEIKEVGRSSVVPWLIYYSIESKFNLILDDNFKLYPLTANMCVPNYSNKWVDFKWFVTNDAGV